MSSGFATGLAAGLALSGSGAVSPDGAIACLLVLGGSLLVLTALIFLSYWR